MINDEKKGGGGKAFLVAPSVAYGHVHKGSCLNDSMIFIKKDGKKVETVTLKRLLLSSKSNVAD